MIAVLIVAALLLLPGHPIRPYIRSFFVGGFLCVCAEGLTGSLLGVYQVRAGLLGDLARDGMLAGSLVSGIIHPLMAVNFVRLARRRPLVWALAGSVALGLLEVWFVKAGYLQYRVWHPAASAVFYFGFLWASWLEHSHRWTVPIPAYIFFTAFWLSANSSHLLHGVLGLWQYPVTQRGDPILGSHLASNLYTIALVIPVATLVGVLSRKWAPIVVVLVGALGLLAAEALMKASGGIEFVRWNFWLSAARYTVELGAVVLYARWMFPNERGQGAVTDKKAT